MERGSAMHKIEQVKALQAYRLWLRFSDGVEGTVDLSYLAGRGVFKLWENYEDFQKVRIGDTGELLWDDSVDLCPDSLYLKITGKKVSDVFANSAFES
jgi:hypothetical protein